MIKLDFDFVQNLYYGGNELKKALSKLTGYDVDFVGASFDDSDKENIKNIEFDAEGEKEINDENPIEFEVTGEVKDNMVIFNNTFNNSTIILNLKDGKYIY
jgi:hypothetical protein